MGMAVGRPLIVEACVLALLARIGLRALALPRLVHLLGRLPRSRRGGDESGSCLEAARLAAVRVAHPTCLIESLVGYAMLRRRGRDAAFHIGVSARPGFAAHAWLTLDAQSAVGEEPGYTVLWQHRAR